MNRSPAVRIAIAVAVLVAIVLVARYGGGSLLDLMRRMHHRA